MADTKQVMSWLEGLTDDDWPLFHSHSEVQNIAEAALELLKEQPDIVRCRDCKQRQSRVMRVIDNQVCYWCEMSKGYRKLDYFCADGKHKSAEEKLMEEMDADPLG